MARGHIGVNIVFFWWKWWKSGYFFVFCVFCVIFSGKSGGFAEKGTLFKVGNAHSPVAARERQPNLDAQTRAGYAPFPPLQPLCKHSV